MIKKFESGDKSQLSPHFNVQEFKCKCGKEHEILLSTELVDKLEKLYSALNCSKIMSNYLDYNASTPIDSRVLNVSLSLLKN